MGKYQIEAWQDQLEREDIAYVAYLVEDLVQYDVARDLQWFLILQSICMWEDKVFSTLKHRLSWSKKLMRTFQNQHRKKLTLDWKNVSLSSEVQSKPILLINCHFLKWVSKKYCCLYWRAASILLNWREDWLWFPNQVVKISNKRWGSSKWSKAVGKDLIKASIKIVFQAEEIEVSRRSRSIVLFSIVLKILAWWALILRALDAIWMWWV